MQNEDAPRPDFGIVPAVIPAAVRVYPQPCNAEKSKDELPRAKPRGLHTDVRRTFMVLDTETAVDTSQRLKFGSYRLISDGVCVEEAMFFADDLPASEHALLERYCGEHKDAALSARPVRLLSLSNFLKKLYANVYQARFALVGFNLPFDLSRLAFEWQPARRDYAGGVSLGIWYYVYSDGVKHINQYRPPIAIKHIDSKRALIGFRSRRSPDDVDLIPEGSQEGQPVEGYVYPGKFIDLRTLGFALTSKTLSLDSALREFGLPERKRTVDHHGVITPDYIDYNRDDVRLTALLADAMLDEWDRHGQEFSRHGIDRHAGRVFSIATFGKLYLRAMGIRPVLERQPDFPKWALGAAMSAFFGGRASCRIRRLPMPCVYLDFLSMYPTVNCLLGLWPFTIAREIKVISHCESDIEGFLREIQANPRLLYDPAAWKRITAFVRIIPDGDPLPLRAKYGAGESWNIGINHVYSDAAQPEALWYALPDVAASVILAGRLPKIVDAFRIAPEGIQDGLEPVKLRGAVEIDPAKQDFFKTVIEERKRLRGADPRLDLFLKILANSTAYGIGAEMLRRESDAPVKTTVYGPDREPYTIPVTHPEDRGQFCFPPTAALITSGARLMLAMVEREVTQAGGVYALEDTDSMAIVATEQGGLVPCPGGLHRMDDGRAAVRGAVLGGTGDDSQQVCVAESI